MENLQIKNKIKNLRQATVTKRSQMSVKDATVENENFSMLANYVYTQITEQQDKLR